MFREWDFQGTGTGLWAFQGPLLAPTLDLRPKACVLPVPGAGLGPAGFLKQVAGCVPDHRAQGAPAPHPAPAVSTTTQLLLFLSIELSRSATSF